MNYNNYIFKFAVFFHFLFSILRYAHEDYSMQFKSIVYFWEKPDQFCFVTTKTFALDAYSHVHSFIFSLSLSLSYYIQVWLIAFTFRHGQMRMLIVFDTKNTKKVKRKHLKAKNKRIYNEMVTRRMYYIAKRPENM